MFQRRLKVFLFILVIASAALAIRATQIQIVHRDFYQQLGHKMAQRREFIETTRGTIFDRKDRPLAEDSPCVDACVDYRAITEEPDPDWLTQIAFSNLKHKLSGEEYRRAERHPEDDPAVQAEVARLRANISAMWDELALVGDQTPDQLNELRQQIVARVEMRKQSHTWATYRAALKSSMKNQVWYRRLFAADPSADDAIDNYQVEVVEETQPHAILHTLTTPAQARLAREQERFFCLSLLPGKYRDYPRGDAACHVLGYLSPVKPDEQTVTEGSTVTDDDDEEKYLQGYWAQDLIGRAGLEAMCEKTLRGSRGYIEKSVETDEVLNRVDPVPGGSVHSTIDIELERDVEREFQKERVHVDNDMKETETHWNQHGAAVVIDVTNNEVLAMVSYPGYDLNTLQTTYETMAVDDLNSPLMNRATEMAVEPGSTVKTIVGAGAITHGYMTAEDKIECTGYLTFGSRKILDSQRCWTVALTALHPDLGSVPSHKAISHDPTLSDDNKLTIAQGLKNSCNVVFETIADKMQMGELSFWYDRFGLGRPTGIGIDESPGRLYRPTDSMRHQMGPMTWSAGIGEGVVHATVLQMANVAATFARDGVWMRPRLICQPDESSDSAPRKKLDTPDSVDLGLTPEALKAVKDGMCGVCSDDLGNGTGLYILPKHIERGPDDPPLDEDPLLHIRIAGKTGTAQTGQLLTVYQRDGSGNVKVDSRGQPIFRKVPFCEKGTEGWYVPPIGPNPEKHVAHAWFIGYAPADHPQVAFCVLVEYGEAGGRVAGAIAHDILVDCYNHQYLSNGK
jgi:penicillin-binding protein 2